MSDQEASGEPDTMSSAGMGRGSSGALATGRRWMGWGAVLGIRDSFALVIG
jgi:hypothetical protein